jgi:formyltetrahydrofolate deformylase
MLTFGATAHFIVPELDAGGQIIHQETFSVAPGTPLEEVTRIGRREHEPRCLVEGLRRVLDREVERHFHKVVTTARPANAAGERRAAGVQTAGSAEWKEHCPC